MRVVKEFFGVIVRFLIDLQAVKEFVCRIVKCLFELRVVISLLG